MTGVVDIRVDNLLRDVEINNFFKYFSQIIFYFPIAYKRIIDIILGIFRQLDTVRILKTEFLM